MNGETFLASMSAGVLVAIGLLLLVQLTLWIVALTILIKTPAERITIGGRKWVWALIIVLGEIVGSILFLALGRKPSAAIDSRPSSPVADRATAAADALYGAPTAAPAPSQATPPSPAPVAPAAPIASPTPASAPSAPPAPPGPDSPAATPEALTNDPEIGADGTGSGELP